MKNKCDVLNLEWTSYPSRDRQSSTLVCNYLRFLGYNVVEESIFKGVMAIQKHRPKLLFISNTIGAGINYEIVRYAKHRGVKVVSAISEGNFQGDKEALAQFIWGWNDQKKLYENLHLQWTERTRRLTLDIYPELRHKIKVSGGIGFDVYKIAKSMSKKSFLNRYDKNYSKIVGVGCWDFGAYLDEKDTRHRMVLKKYDKNVFERFANDCIAFNLILKKTIEENPDILFLLKEHPGNQLGHKSSGIEGCDRFDNVLILKEEESVFDCIAVSDFWVVYESTTALESWLLGKQTLLLNPSGRDFPRDITNAGSPDIATYEQFQEVLDGFYQNSVVKNFDVYAERRKNVITNVIQFDDGFNHVRAGNEVAKVLETDAADSFLVGQGEYSKSFVFKEWVKELLYRLKLRRQPGYKAFDYQEISSFSKQRYQEQLDFYEKNKMTKTDLKSITCL